MKNKNKRPPSPEVVLTAEEATAAPEVTTPLTPLTPPAVRPAVAPAVPTPKLMDVDRMALELAQSRRQTALAEAKTAMANNEKAELAYKYIVLQIYMKYGLTDADAISEAGDIVRGGALAKP